MSAAIDLYATLVQQVDAVVASTCALHSDPAAGPTIAQIEYTIDTDWSGDDAIHFLVIVHDPPAGTPLDFKALRAIAREMEGAVSAQGIPRIPYVAVRLASEQAALSAAQAVTSPP